MTATDLITSINTTGGFTFDSRTSQLVTVGTVSGYAIAIPGTERVVGSGSISRDEFASRFASLVREFADLLDSGAFIGGWFSTERDLYIVEISEIHNVDRDSAVRIGQARNQEAVLDMATGELIETGGTGDE